MNIKKGKETMNIKKGREIFFECYGSRFCIDREYGDEYEKCNIPKVYEQQWMQEVKELLRFKIYDASGYDLFYYVDTYSDLLKANEAINYLLSFLKEKKIDSFTSLLLLEECKRKILLLNNSDEKIEYLNEIEVLKAKYLSKPICIDSSYLKVDSSITKDIIINRYKAL